MMSLYILKNALSTSEQIADLHTYIISQQGPAVLNLIKTAMRSKQTGRTGRQNTKHHFFYRGHPIVFISDKNFIQYSCLTQLI